MKITCPMCDGNSVPTTELEIVLDCDWCGGQGCIEESDNRFLADEEIEAEEEDWALPAWY
ncbi:MAG: hypothetical protein LDL41_20365 [Coleofasciculus sp. S288]|nr:hypothetical protein [Coleofasciculus sp. S288]